MKLAFVIGCSSYDDPDIADLDFSDDDAKDFAAAIEKNCGFSQEDIRILSSNHSDRRFWPTKSNIIRLLKPRLQRNPPIDTVWFFFSGHGLHSSRDQRDYLVPQDAAANELEDSSILFEKLLDYLRGWSAVNTVLFLDACRAVIQGGKTVNIEEWQQIDIKSLHRHGMASISSCSPYQKSYESEELKNGLFTFGLCEAVSDRGKCRTLYELDHYLATRIPSLCKEYQKPIQNPYTRVEPISILHTEIVSEAKSREWQKSVNVGSEIRTRPPSATKSFESDREDLMCAIDFGTSFSSVALLDKDSNVTLIPSGDGRTLLPSVISFAPSGDYFVGWPALENAKLRKGTTVYSVKRSLGKKQKFNINGKSLTPEFLASLIIRSLKKNAEEYAKTRISRVLVSAPANFNIRQTNALVTAFEMADFKVFRVIGEPCASAIAFYSVNEESLVNQDKVIVVLDLGGGTFDVSIMDASEGVCETLAVAGNNDLGGTDYDTAIFNYAILESRKHIELPDYQFSEIDLAELRAEAQRVKVALNSRPETSIVIQNLQLESNDLMNFDIPIDRQIFREITVGLNGSAEECITQALRLAKVNAEDVDLVFLAGQGSKLFTVREVIEKLFPHTPIASTLQETAVVQGLCLYSGVLRGVFQGLLLLDTNYCAIAIKYRESADSDDVDFLISGVGEENKLLAEVLPLRTTIPNRKTYSCKATNVKSNVKITVVEINTFGQVEHPPIGEIEVEVPNDGEFELTVDVDNSRTIYFAIANPATKKIHYYRINNLFYGDDHSSSGKHFSSDAYLTTPHFRRLEEAGYTQVPPQRISDP